MSTFLLCPESAFGPTNNLIGIGAELLRRGERVVFAAESSWRGRLEPYGFEERLYELAPPPGHDSSGGTAAGRSSSDRPASAAPVVTDEAETPEERVSSLPEEPEAGQFWKDFVAATAPSFRLGTSEQLEAFMLPTWTELVAGARFAEQRLTEIVDEVEPDVVVEDNVVCFPALARTGERFVRVVSCNPLELPDPGLPPAYSGLPTADPTGWASFRAAYDRSHRALWGELSGWVQECGLPPLPDLEFVHSGPRRNLYLYPAELDYPRSRPLGGSWVRLDSCVRATEAGWEPPDAAHVALGEVLERRLERRRRSLAEGAGPAAGSVDARSVRRGGTLVYLSLGSLGGADVELMRRLVGELAEAEASFIVSKGPRGAEVELAENMWGADMVPQTEVLPLVDAVISHGGNNTVTEAMHFGVPLLVLPLFWDQHDNAQRIAETGFGRRLDPYGFAGGTLRRALDAVLADASLAGRAREAGEAIRARNGRSRAADALQEVARALSRR